MTPDDTPIPNDDPVARAARRGLGGIVGSDTPGELSWVAVQSGARRVRRRRLTALASACAIVVVAAGAALAAGRNDDNHVRVAGGSTTSSAPATTTSTTTVPSAAHAGDVTGTIAIGSPPTDVQPAIVAEVGSNVALNTTIRNVSDGPIWPSSSTDEEITSFATVCAGESPGARSLWWMTNILLAAGNKTARSGTFTPTDAYVGTVTCALDVVTTDQQHAFDTSAGGDATRGTIIARVPGVPQVKLQVVPARWKVTTTGGVGPLQLGTSTAVDVVTAAGAPDAKSRGTFGVTGYPDFQALGYDCSAQSASDRISLHPQPNETGPYCRTVFFVNVDTATLAAFNTTSDKYETANVSVGTAVADAEQREGRPAVNGCFRGIALGDISANPYEVFIWVVAGQPNATVSSISAEAASNQVGLMFC